MAPRPAKVMAQALNVSGNGERARPGRRERRPRRSHERLDVHACGTPARRSFGARLSRKPPRIELLNRSRQRESALTSKWRGLTSTTTRFLQNAPNGSRRRLPSPLPNISKASRLCVSRILRKTHGRDARATTEYQVMFRDLYEFHSILLRSESANEKC